MKTNDVLMVAAVAAVAYLVGSMLFPRKAWTTAGGVPVIDGSQQAQQLADQCGGWAECVAGL
jgi:hypothetical protein